MFDPIPIFRLGTLQVKNYTDRLLKQLSEAYDSEDYKLHIQKKVLHLPKNSWKQLLEEGETQKQAFLSVLTQISSKEEADDFIECFSETLKRLFLLQSAN